MPNWRCAVLYRKSFDGIACREAISEAGTHDSGEGCDQKAAFQIKLFDGGALLLCGHLLFFRHPCRSSKNDAEETDDDTNEDDPP